MARVAGDRPAGAGWAGRSPTTWCTRSSAGAAGLPSTARSEHRAASRRRRNAPRSSRSCALSSSSTKAPSPAPGESTRSCGASPRSSSRHWTPWSATRGSSSTARRAPARRCWPSRRRDAAAPPASASSSSASTVRCACGWPTSSPTSRRRHLAGTAAARRCRVPTAVGLESPCAPCTSRCSTWPACLSATTTATTATGGGSCRMRPSARFLKSRRRGRRAAATTRRTSTTS